VSRSVNVLASYSSAWGRFELCWLRARWWRMRGVATERRGRPPGRRWSRGHPSTQT